MARILVSTEQMEHDKWLSYRKQGIGGSDVSKICGINKYESTIELYLDKTGQSLYKPAGESAYWGTTLEPIVREEFIKRTGFNVRLEKNILQHDFYDFMYANIDGIVEHPTLGDCVFEAKTSSVYRLDEWENGIPEEYMLQVQHYMAVTGYKAAFVAVLIGGSKFMWYRIDRDEDLINMLYMLENDFWQHVVNRIPPELDGSEASTEYVSQKYSKANATQIELPQEAVALISQYELASEQEKEAVSLKECASNKLKDMLGENEIGLVADRKITWKNSSTERFDSKAFKVAMPDIFSQYLNITQSRRFLIK